MIMYVLGLTIYLSVGIFYNLHALNDYWTAERDASYNNKFFVIVAFMFAAFCFPFIAALNIYDRKYH